MQLHTDAGMQLPNMHGGLGKHIHDRRLSGRDMHIALNLLARSDFGFGAVGELHDFARTPVQQLPFMRQLQRTPTIASYEQRGTHLFFQVFDLPRQRRLADTQYVGGGGDALFLHYRDKIAQYFDFHNRLVPPPTMHQHIKYMHFFD